MRAIVMTEFGAPDVLTASRVPRPEPAADEVRIRVAAVAVRTTLDVLTRSGGGAFSRVVTPPHILGGEHAGWVDAVGSEVEPELVGRRVAVRAAYSCGHCRWCAAGQEQACQDHKLIGVHRQGSYAEYTVVPRSTLFDVPDDMSFVDAAVLLATGPIAFAQLRAASLGAGDVLIVPGITGAMGSTVAALAASRGARVVGLARHAGLAESFAASAIVDVTAGDLEARLREACGADGATAVIDNICTEPGWDACLAVLAPLGRVVISGTFGSGQAGINTRRLYLNNQSVIGVRTSNAADERAFWEQASHGFRLPSGLVQTAPLADAAEIHRQMENGPKNGHYALTVGDWDH
jgi:D-arabinose 1-dehydrogenase-like Zn-dependent alcohol dehydrogenase